MTNVFKLEPAEMPIICPAEKCRQDFFLKHVEIFSKGGFTDVTYDIVKQSMNKHAERVFETGPLASN